MNLLTFMRYAVAVCGIFGLGGAGAAQNGNQTAVSASVNAASTMTIPKPPTTPQQPVTHDYSGHKVVDPYQWLEDSTSPETQQWVSEQLAYTRSILDRLPGRDKLHARLEQLLQIDNLGQTAVGGASYFHTRRDGQQNQPVLYVRKGFDGKDDVLVDVNQLSKDGTVALDWWQPSHDGSMLASAQSEAAWE